MLRRLGLVPLSLLLTTLPAEAAPECKVPVYVWELELTRVERLEGAIDPNAVIQSLGSRARLRGSYRQRGRAARAELVGSTDGAGLSVSGEKRDP